MSKKAPKLMNTARRRLDDIDCINSGGCGIAALALARWARQCGLAVDGFVFMDDDKEECEANARAIQSNNLHIMNVPNHIAVIINQVYYDTYRTYHQGDNYYPNKLTVRNEKVLLYLLNEVDGWNDMFDRETGIPAIEHALGIDLSDVAREIV